MAFVSFGDSVTHGYPVDPQQIWAQIVANYAGEILDNKAVGSSQAADQAYLASQISLSAEDTYGVFLGINDLTYYGNDPVKRRAYIDYLRALIVNCSCATRVSAQSMGKSGAWSPFAPTGSLTNEVGAKAAASVAGQAAYAVFRNQNNGAVTDGAISDIRSDGELKSSRIGNGAQVGNTYLGRDYAPQALRISGLSPGAHSLEICHGSPGKYTLLEYAAGSEQAHNPHIYVLNIPMRSNDPTYRGDYNTDLKAMVSELAADGRNVHFVDIASRIGPEHLDPDGVHINVAGHALIASIVTDVMNDAMRVISYSCINGGALTVKLNTQGQAIDFVWK